MKLSCMKTNDEGKRKKIKTKKNTIYAEGKETGFPLMSSRASLSRLAAGDRTMITRPF